MSGRREEEGAKSLSPKVAEWKSPERRAWDVGMAASLWLSREVTFRSSGAMGIVMYIAGLPAEHPWQKTRAAAWETAWTFYRRYRVMQEYFAAATALLNAGEASHVTA